MMMDSDPPVSITKHENWQQKHSLQNIRKRGGGQTLQVKKNVHHQSHGRQIVARIPLVLNVRKKLEKMALSNNEDESNCF